MVLIKVTKGLDIPIDGTPSGELRNLPIPSCVSLNLSPFEEIKFKLLANVGQTVKVGEPLAEDKHCPGRVFVSPAGGVIKEIRRGAKRRLLDIVIELSSQEERLELGALSLSSPREKIIERLMQGGLFAHIRMRPFNLLANPGQVPKSIFVKACETAPLATPAEMQVKGFEKEFQLGLSTLSKLTPGKVHLVYSANSTCQTFSNAQDVMQHTVLGPHPAANHSVHIFHIDPIRKVDEVVWTLSVHDVICIGAMMAAGTYHTSKVISIAGGGVLSSEIGFYKARMGYPVGGLISGRISSGLLRLVSGDVLTGGKVGPEDFLGFYDCTFSVIPENTERQFLHFVRLGVGKYSATKAYLSGHFKPGSERYEFNTNQHGEERAFVDGSVYDAVMPLPIPTMHLVKALLAEDYETAEMFGLLEVDCEDFALPTFICPSKIEMVEIVKNALKAHSKEVGISQ